LGSDRRSVSVACGQADCRREVAARTIACDGDAGGVDPKTIGIRVGIFECAVAIVECGGSGDFTRFA
jgi:hypothetical protein